MGVVYRILNVATDMFYVGSTSNHRRRKWEHWSQLKHGTHHCAPLQRAWDTYGEDAFEFEVLEECDDNQLPHIEETYLIKYASSTACYNIALSAHQSPALLKSVQVKISTSLRRKYAEDLDYQPRLGSTHSAETREVISRKVQHALAEGRGGKFIPSEGTRLRMSEALKGNQNAKGHVRTEEHRRNLSEANRGNQNWLGRTHTKESKAKMSKGVVEVTTNTTFPSLTTALDHYQLKMPTLWRALKSGTPIKKGPHKGLVFRYVDP